MPLALTQQMVFLDSPHYTHSDYDMDGLTSMTLYVINCLPLNEADAELYKGYLTPFCLSF
jgi:hypothetical protein